MTLLIVDDDAAYLGYLCERLAASQTAFDRLLTAHSAREALSLLDAAPVDALLCDIEMPGMDGLSLVGRLRERNAAMPCVMLTSYTLFDYAKRAVSLGIQDYLVKPVREEELLAALDKARARALESESQRVISRYGRYWLSERQNLLDAYWLHRVRTPTDGENVMPPDYETGDRFAPVLVLCFTRRAEWEWASFRYAFEQLARRVTDSACFHLESVMDRAEHGYLMIFKLLNAAAFDLRPLTQALEALALESASLLNAPICCCVGGAAAAGDVGEKARALEKQSRALPIQPGGVFCPEEHTPDSVRYTTPDMESWALLLRAGQADELTARIGKYLSDRVREGSLSRGVLEDFFQDVTQMLYAFLSRHQIEAHRLYADEKSVALFKNACVSAETMRECCAHMISQAAACAVFSEKPASVVGQVRAYLDEHYTEDITLGSLSAAVYLSGDYLSRVFKKEMGASISQYITARRIKHACTLLTDTALPVNAIALQVGYNSFAYFSKVFHDIKGTTPLLYRADHTSRRENG